MAASLQTALQGLQFTDYCSVATITTISYDYLLTFGREVELVWRRPWSLMSSLYVIIRYLGVVLAITDAIWGSIIYMPELVRLCIDTFKFTNWGSYAYMLALEATMILRIFAMYNQSRRLLYFLLGLFFPVVVVELVLTVLYFGPRNGMYVTDIPLPGMQICSGNFSLSPLLYVYFSIPGIVFDGILALFAVARLVQHTIDMKRDLGGWKMNVCMRMLARDSILYFMGNLIYRSFNLIPLTNLPPLYKTLAQAFCSIEPFVLPPRLVISFREYHAQIVSDSDAGSPIESMVFRPGDPNGNND
ncbi:hypothetical protein HYDPIDRAFT_118238 [Hydnomerulius pinastri MD-312]|uniref:Unplaced genomic scaffold scaffold_48, whole genome shotgun sequence n=1 Tax=Hydnomerulius pinastri MD-312 TaxID=994086 RepID=A0A0C9W9U2_9AGAM|nr:hypothetical protein HYDPIDRAFT_118238 [Hydnomerulius pinastri MD-312]